MHQLEQATVSYGLLPFFSNRIPRFSVAAMAAPGCLFGDGSDDHGCWEWKGPVIRMKTCAYGKFFNRKAGFVALSLLPDFINYRRNAYPLKPDSTEEMLLDIIRENEGLTSTELRKIIFGMPKRRKADELVDIAPAQTPTKGRRHSLEGPLQRLQMGGRLLISDFTYKLTSRNERYGWGVACYSTPELWFEQHFDISRTPQESFEILCNHVAERFPFAPRQVIEALLK